MIEKVGRVSSASVEKHTKKDWQKWIDILTKAGATSWTRKTIVSFLKSKYKLTPWWVQVVTHGFEVHTGRRIDGTNIKGEYSTTTIKTYPVTAKKAWEVLSSPEGISIWLGSVSNFDLEPKARFETDDGIFGEIRTMVRGKRLRMTWQESDWEKHTVLQIYIWDRPGKKSMIGFMHEGIKSGRQKMQIKDRWLQVCENLSPLLKK